ncbi:MAG: hypothetical protein AAFV47_07620 [Pseudomonadota bacterium]
MHIDTDPVQFCEQRLQAERAYNVEHNIWPSVNRIIDRVLRRTGEMAPVYREICGTLTPDAVRRLLTVLIEIPAIWNQDYIQRARAAFRRHRELQERVETLSCELAECLREQGELNNTSGYSTCEYVDIVDAIDQAAVHNGHYTSFVQEKLKSLQYQFDDKYWPDLSDIVEVIGISALNATVVPTDSITEAATSSPRPSLADSCRAVMEAVERAKGPSMHDLPSFFRLSDASIATVVNVTTDLGVDDLIDAAYIKRLRQRDREAAAAQGAGDLEGAR